MLFNPDKCEVISVKNKKKNYHIQVLLHGVSLKEPDSAKYLGVNLSWGKYINHITTKTNKNALNFIKCNIPKESAYKTYVRPLVEYAASVWDP